MSRERTAMMNNTENVNGLDQFAFVVVSVIAIPVIEGFENKRFKRNVPETTFSINTEVFMLIYIHK